MPRASKIIASICFAGFILILWLHPEAETETTTGFTVAELVFSAAFLLWLALSSITVLYGVFQVFVTRGFRVRMGHFTTVALSLPGIVYSIYVICADAA